MLVVARILLEFASYEYVTLYVLVFSFNSRTLQLTVADQESKDMLVK